MSSKPSAKNRRSISRTNSRANFENCRLGIIPAGTGNDFAACAGIPLDPLKALDLVLNGEAKYTDYMQLDGGVRGINIIGTGIDVEILQRCRRSKILRGKLQYIFSLVISLFKFKNYSVRTECNGQEHRYQSLIACVGNGTTLGGGYVAGWAPRWAAASVCVPRRK